MSLKKIGLTAALGMTAVVAFGFGFSQARDTEDSSPAPSSARQCLDGSSIDTRVVLEGNKLLLEDGFGRAAVVTVGSPCSRMDQMDIIGFEFSGTTSICDRYDVKILHSRTGESPNRCLITSVKMISREEARALTRG